MSEPSQGLRGHAHDERHVWYCLQGDFDPDDITAPSGLTPTQTRRAGDRPNPRTTHRPPHSMWEMDSGLAPCDEFDEHLDALFERLQPGWVALTVLGDQHEAWSTAAISCREAQGPLVQVEPRAAVAPAELNATLGFDIYALPEIEPDGTADGRPITRTELDALNALLAGKDAPPGTT